jgi:hypothetical protein
MVLEAYSTSSTVTFSSSTTSVRTNQQDVMKDAACDHCRKAKQSSWVPTVIGHEGPKIGPMATKGDFWEKMLGFARDCKHEGLLVRANSW